MIPGDAPRSDLELPLKCFNCDFTVGHGKYPALETQRWRLMTHETGKSGHGWGPCTYRCVYVSCGKWFNNSFHVRVHCRNEFHALPKRYCTKVEVEAMSVLDDGLSRISNTQPTGPHARKLDEIFTRQYTAGTTDSISARRVFRHQSKMERVLTALRMSLRRACPLQLRVRLGVMHITTMLWRA